MQEEIGNLNSIAQDGMSGLAITKSFNLVKIIEERFKRVNRDVVHKGLNIARLSSGVDIFSGVLGFSPFLIAFGFGGYLAITGQITFGSIFAFINLLNYVVNPLSSIPRLVGNLSQSVGAAQRIFEILDHDIERSSGTVLEPAHLQGEIIRFQDASFTYDSGSSAAVSPAAASHVLQDVSFDIQPGEKIAIVGPSGSGKHPGEGTVAVRTHPGRADSAGRFGGSDDHEQPDYFMNRTGKLRIMTLNSGLRAFAAACCRESQCSEP